MERRDLQLDLYVVKIVHVTMTRKGHLNSSNSLGLSLRPHERINRWNNGTRCSFPIYIAHH